MTRIPSDAFEFYVSLGPERSYKAVAEKYDVTKRAITKCANREDWPKRLEKIEHDARENSDKKLTETLEEVRNRHLQTVRAMTKRALQGLQQFQLTTGIEAMRAAEMAIKLERLILGEPSERTEMSVEEITRRELKDFLVAGDDEEEAQDDEQIAEE